MSTLARLVVLVSGSGTNLQAIINVCQAGQLAAEVVAVISNKPEAFGLTRAHRARIQAIYKPKRNTQTRHEYDAELAQMVKEFMPDWVVLAGWMCLLSMDFLSHFPERVINLHPALPGQFPGTHAIERAYRAFRQGKITETGVMVHLVPDEGVDNGPVLAQETVPILPKDSQQDLENRIHAAEHRLLITTLQSLIPNS